MSREFLKNIFIEIYQFEKTEICSKNDNNKFNVENLQVLHLDF